MLNDIATPEESQKISEVVEKLDDQDQNDDDDSPRDQKSINFELFSCENRLCSIFPLVSIELPNKHKLVRYDLFMNFKSSL